MSTQSPEDARDAISPVVSVIAPGAYAAIKPMIEASAAAPCCRTDDLMRAMSRILDPPLSDRGTRKGDQRCPCLQVDLYSIADLLAKSHNLRIGN